MTECREFSLLLVDFDFDIANTQVFGQAKGVPFVVLRSSALTYCNHDGLLHVRCQNLVQSVRVGSFFEDEPAIFGDGFQSLTLQFPTTGAEDGNSAA